MCPYIPFIPQKVEYKHAWYLTATSLSSCVAVGYFNNWFLYRKWFIKFQLMIFGRTSIVPSLPSSPSHHFPISFHYCLSKTCVLWAPPCFRSSLCRRYSCWCEKWHFGCDLCCVWEQGQVLSCCLSHFAARDLGLNYLAGWLPRQDIAFMFVQCFEHTNTATNIESLLENVSAGFA